MSDADRLRRILENLVENAVKLSIVKHLAEGVGAVVSVESQLGRGTRFTLTVPSGQEHCPG